MNSPNSLSVNSSNSLPQNSTLVTTKELARILTVGESTIKRMIEKLRPVLGEVVKNRQGGFLFNEEQSTLIKKEIQKHHNLANRQIDNVSTEIEENETIIKAFSILQQRNEKLQNEVKFLQPKADVYDKICNSETLKPVDQVASNLGYGKNNFFALMRGMGIFYYSSKDADGIKVNLPKQEYKDRGYFVTKEEPYNRGDKDCLYTKIYVTGKGEIWLAKKLTEETAEAFMEKGEAEYHKIIDKTAENYLEKAIKNCPESNNTLVDKIQTFTFKQVADAIGEEESTIINFCKAKRWINNDNIPVYMPNNNYFLNGKLTVEGRDHIIAVFSTIARAEKGMKQFSCGKGE